MSIETDSIPPSQAIVERVAAREGVDHTDLVRLYDAIDPEALDRFIETSQETDSTAQIAFSYHGYTVTVSGDGQISLSSEAETER